MTASRTQGAGGEVVASTKTNGNQLLFRHSEPLPRRLRENKTRLFRQRRSFGGAAVARVRFQEPRQLREPFAQHHTR